MGRTTCTEPQCLYKGALYLTVDLYLYSPYGPYDLYRASVPVEGCTLPCSRAIPLLPLWAVRPVQCLSACTRVHFTFTFTFTRENAVDLCIARYTGNDAWVKHKRTCQNESLSLHDAVFLNSYMSPFVRCFICNKLKFKFMHSTNHIKLYRK